MNRRVAITGIGVRAPGGRNSKEFWELISAGASATRSISLFDASAFRSQDRGGMRFRPGRGGAVDRRRSGGWTGRRSSPWSAAREAVADSGLDPSGIDPFRIGVSRRQRRRRHHEPGPGVRRGQRRRRELAGATTSYAVPHLFDYFVPSSFARRGRLGGRRRGPGRGGLHRLHLRAGRGRPRGAS